MNTNYYVILGVGADATPDEIQAAYRRRALELHPDRYGPDSEPFLQLKEAYETLAREHEHQVRFSPAVRRPTSTETLRARDEAEPMRAGHPRQARREPLSLTRSFETYGPSFDELFDRFWSNFASVTRPKAESIESLSVEIPLSPEESAQGGQVEIMIPTRVPCPTCHGHGAVAGYECWRCEGHGSLTADYPLSVAFPAGILNEHTARIPLQRFGISNFYLTVRFRVTASAE